MKLFPWITFGSLYKDTIDEPVKIPDDIQAPLSAPAFQMAQKQRDDGSQNETRTQAERWLVNNGSSSLKGQTPHLDAGEFEIHDLQKRYADLQHTYRLQQLDQVELRESNEELSRQVECRQKKEQALLAKYIVLKRSSVSSELYETARGEIESLNIGNRDLRDRNKNIREARKRLEKDFDELESKCADTESELDSLKLELANSQRQLQACKDDLFRLKPEAQLPDDVVVAEYEMLCEQVVTWIDGEIYKFTRTCPETTLVQMFTAGECAEANQLVHENLDLGEYLVRCMVHVSLCEFLLDRKSYLQGLSGGINNFLEGVERSMREGDPAKGKFQVSER